MPTAFGHNPRRNNTALMYFKRLASLIIAVTVSSLWNGGMVFAYPPKGAKTICEINMPTTHFFGSLSLVLKTDNPWACELPNGYIVEIVPWKTTSTAEYWNPVTQYNLYLTEESGDFTKIEEARIANGEFANPAIKIEQSNRGLMFTAAGGKVIFEKLDEIVPPLPANGSINVVADISAKILKCENRFEEYPAAKRYDIENFEPIKLREGVPDNHTGYWHYLDKVTPKSHRAVVGGRYRIAIVPDTENQANLLIVYLDGATDDAEFWSRGDIKGIMTPTSFANHYNVIWLDSRRRQAGMNECSATFDGINLLTIDFPLLESQIRFEREME